MKYVDPKNDLIFYKIFGKHPHILLSFLNSVMPFDTPIACIEYVKNDLSASPTSSDALLKVHCTDQNERQFAVEIQIDWLQTFLYPRIFDETKVYIQTFRAKTTYTPQILTYALSIHTQNFDTSTDFYHLYQEVYVNGKRVENLEFVMIELEKFKYVNTAENKVMTQWLQFLNLKDGFYDIDLDLLTNKDIKEATDLLNFGLLSPDEDHIYDRYWDAIRVARSRESHRKTVQIVEHLFNNGLEDNTIGMMTDIPTHIVEQIRMRK